MNRAAADVSLGTMLQYLGTFASGSLTVTNTQASASLVVITPGVSPITGFIFNGYRSGSPLNQYLNVLSGSVAGTIVVQKATNVSGSVIASGDIYTYMAYK
jgi:hypothetical protein